jgi:hypothetical protein
MVKCQRIADGLKLTKPGTFVIVNRDMELVPNLSASVEPTMKFSFQLIGAFPNDERSVPEKLVPGAKWIGITPAIISG